MSTQGAVCQNCKKGFVIEPDDFEFYKKIDVPPPTWCPECRNMRRMAWREERALYRGTCALCGKGIITIHAPEGPFTVYCRECYRSDKWDPMDYGREYDFTKPFFKQYRELMETVPRPALTGTNIVNSEYSHACEGVKNCYYVFWCYYSENSQNSYGLLLSRDSYDCYAADNSDHAYECLQCNRLYKIRYGYFSDDCFDSAFLYNCVGCSDCFGCVNLRKQKYHVFNKKLSREDYKKEMEYWDLGSYQRLQEAKEKFKQLYLSLPHPYAHMVNCQNVTGDILRDAKDCKMCFWALDGVQNCKYLFGAGLGLKDSQDVAAGGDSGELLYEVYGVTGHVQRCMFSAGGGNCQDVWYCDWPNNSSHLFGCISVKNRKYCILNKQYSAEEYKALVREIRAHMDEMPYVDSKGRVYRFGEFFPPELSAYAYNESFGFLWHPKTKEEVLAEGWRWQEAPKRTYKATIEPEHLPDHIKDVPDSITDEIIACAHHGECNEQCATAFRVTEEELAFYHEMNLALPRLCFSCRYVQKLNWRNGIHLYPRSCDCRGNKSAKSEYRNTARHAHGDEPCSNAFETTFSPDQKEIVYCDACYKSEFL